MAEPFNNDLELKRLSRYLETGQMGPGYEAKTYYQINRDNVDMLEHPECISVLADANCHSLVLEKIKGAWNSGKSNCNDLLLALAYLCHGSKVPDGKMDPCKDARDFVVQVCRDGDSRDILNFFLFSQYMDKRGRHAGRGLRRILQAWYDRQDPKNVTFLSQKCINHAQVIKSGHVKGKDSGTIFSAKRQCFECDLISLQIITLC